MAHGLTEKLIRRHPHVFGETSADDSTAVLKQWDAIKKTEKGNQPESHLSGVTPGLPSLMRAQKLQKKAARVGFDWPDVAPVIAKIREEADEVEEAIAEGNADAMIHEVGDLLFSVVNLARKLGVDAESALAATNERFVRRFTGVEERLVAAGKKIGEATLAEMDAAWDEVKAAEKLSP